MTPRQTSKVNTLLRRVARLVINSVEFDGKMTKHFLADVRFPRALGHDIHNYLRASDRDYILLLRRRRRHERKFRS